jgi:hypothetical protein
MFAQSECHNAARGGKQQGRSQNNKLFVSAGNSLMNYKIPAFVRFLKFS